MERAIARGEKKLGDIFAVNFFMEKEMIKQFKRFIFYNSNMQAGDQEGNSAPVGTTIQVNPRINELKQLILDGLRNGSALGIQNDGCVQLSFMFKHLFLIHAILGCCLYQICDNLCSRSDEMVNARVLNHLKHCQIRPEVQSILNPCFSFKVHVVDPLVVVATLIMHPFIQFSSAIKLACSTLLTPRL